MKAENPVSYYQVKLIMTSASKFQELFGSRGKELLDHALDMTETQPEVLQLRHAYLALLSGNPDIRVKQTRQ